MADSDTKPLLSNEDKEKFRQYLKELDDQRRNAMLAAWEAWKVSLKASPMSHVLTAVVVGGATKWLLPIVVLKWLA